MISALLAVSLSFTATATGVEKGTPVEFVFAAAHTDRDYETLFLLDEGIDSLCARMERAGFPRGCPTDVSGCRLWPVGCTVTFTPSVETFLAGSLPEGFPEAKPIYTGGTRLANGCCAASTNMPAAFYSTYTLSQAPIVLDGIFPQGDVYNSFTARETLKKGERYTFTISCSNSVLPKSVMLTAAPGGLADVVRRLQEESRTGDLSATVAFDESLSIDEAVRLSSALATVDSVKIKINGCSNIFYRAFLPPEKWRDRQERIQQPFELTIDGAAEKLVYVESDWTVDGPDPKLTEYEISFSEAVKHPETDTCFIYIAATEKVGRILKAMKRFDHSKIRNWYVFKR